MHPSCLLARHQCGTPRRAGPRNSSATLGRIIGFPAGSAVRDPRPLDQEAL